MDLLRLIHFIAVLAATVLSIRAVGHPLVEDALEVVISRDRVTVDARISLEEVQVAANLPAKPAAEDAAVSAHGDYVLRHLRVEADGEVLDGKITVSNESAYRVEFATAKPPAVIRIGQNLLEDHPPWSVSCIVRFRQSDQATYQTGLLRSGETAEFGCTWNSDSERPVAAERRTATAYWSLFRAYVRHGVLHILTGYDHLLFVSALVLAAVSFWDLVKVVTAFTLAHTLTLTLATLKIFSLDEHVVEPMISASIVFVAVQNIVAPRGSRGWLRYAVAFAFGLFHGLGFAGGLSDAMSALPRTALWVALGAFSLGVELGHQVVVIPLFGMLAVVRRKRVFPLAMKIGSACIAICGMYYFVQALRGHFD